MNHRISCLNACLFKFSYLFFPFFIISGCSTFQSEVGADSGVGRGQTYISPVNTVPWDKRHYKVIELKNKLQVLLISDMESTTSGAALAVGAGSFQDPLEHQGLAHYLEHMLFLGTKKYPDPNGFRAFVEGHGGNTNATTFSELTRYYFVVDNNAFDEGLDRFSEFFKAPLFDKTYSEKEIAAIDNEWSLKSKTFWATWHRALSQNVNQDHPYSLFSMGNKETLRFSDNSSLYDAMKTFHKDYYSANLMKLVLYGNKPVSELEESAFKYFNTIPNKNADRPKVTSRALNKGMLMKHIYVTAKGVNNLLLFFPIENNDKQWRDKTNTYINRLLNINQQGSLVYHLKAKGWIKGSGSNINPNQFGNSGYISLVYDLTNEGYKNKDSIIAAVLAYVDFLKSNGGSPGLYDELRGVAEHKRQALHVKPVEFYLNTAVTNIFDISTENILDSEYVYAGLNMKAVKSVLSQLKPENMLIWHGVQTIEEGADIPYTTEQYKGYDFSRVEVENWAKLKKDWAFKKALPNPFLKKEDGFRAERTYFKPKKLVDKNGVEAFLIHDTNKYSDWGGVRIEYENTLGRRSAKDRVLSEIFVRMFYMKNEILLSQIDDSGFRVNIGSGVDGRLIVELHGPTFLHAEIVSALLKEFSFEIFDERIFHEACNELKSAFESTLAGSVRGWMQFLLESYFMNNATSERELIDALTKVKVEDLQEYVYQFKRNNHIRLFAAGNYSEQMVFDLVRISRNKMVEPAVEQRVSESAVGVLKRKSVDMATVGDFANSGFSRSYVVPATASTQWNKIRMLGAIMHTVFFNKLRTEDQLAYDLSVYPMRLYNNEGIILNIVSNSASADKLSERVDIFEQEFMAYLVGMQEDVVDNLKNKWIADLAKKDETLNSTFLYFESWKSGHYDFKTKEENIEELESVTKSDLIALYRSLVVEKNSVVLNVKVKKSEK